MSVYNFRGNLNLLHPPSGNVVILSASDPNDLNISNLTTTFATFHVGPSDTPLTLPTLPLSTSITASNIVIVDSGGNLGVSSIDQIANLTLVGNNGIEVINTFPTYTIQIQSNATPQMGGMISTRTSSTGALSIVDSPGVYAYDLYLYVPASSEIFRLTPLAGRTYHVDLRLSGSTGYFGHMSLRLTSLSTIANIINDQNPPGTVNWAMSSGNLSFTGPSLNWSVGAEVLVSNV